MQKGLATMVRIPPKADMPRRHLNVRFGPKAESCTAISKTLTPHRQESLPSHRPA
jgi:hypothetical protein